MFIGGQRVPQLISIEVQRLSLELAGVSSSGHITVERSHLGVASGFGVVSNLHHSFVPDLPFTCLHESTMAGSFQVEFLKKAGD